LSIEQSRKHGPFDSRYPLIPHKAAPASLWHPGEVCLDWHGFLAMFYPGRRRHDFDALAAYESYGNESEPHRPGQALRRDARRGWHQDQAPAENETERWEGEGGTVTGRPRPPRMR
jgi:hypothetical protein